ncbi:MAG: acyl-CoA dehydrogenase family protein, partial [Gammaproteobacteria bacterium]|nr:acyl-CoA dehydrogenase family protein [Gammaproteobacteria bacterium]
QLGWLAVDLPESAGGSAGGMTELAIVMAAAGGALALEPLLGTVVLGAAAIRTLGTPEQQQMLNAIGAGQRTLAFCHAERDAGYARGYVSCVARAEGDGYVLSGEKSFALHAQAADDLIVSARVGGPKGPMALFLVPRETDGVELSPAPALDGRRGAAVTLADVKVPASARLGAADSDASEVVDALIDRGAIAVCAEAAGAMAEVTEQTVAYLKTREQFGQPLARFQVLQHRLVEMSIAAEEARAATHAALAAMDAGATDTRLKIWRAKVQSARAARFVGGQAIQLHGGMGMTDELAIGHYYKRLTLCETLFGDADWYLKQLARAEAAAA